MRRAPLLAAALGPLLAACAGARPHAAAAPPRVGAIAILPLDNASGRAIPAAALGAAVEASVRAAGVEVVASDRVERWLAEHRLRFTGAIPSEPAAAAAEELGAGAVLITTVEGYATTGVPRIAIAMRLVAAEANPRILWSDSVALAGDDAPGLLAVGVVRTMPKLQGRALAALARSLRTWLATGARGRACPAEPRFAPSVRYRSDLLDGPVRTVAVLPFVNDTPRRRAGDVVAGALARALAATGRFAVAEPGLVRETLIGRRIVLEGGVSLDTARVVLDAIDADLVLAGSVRELSEDVGGPTPPGVEFTALLIDRRTEEVVWEVTSSHRGDEQVRWFDLGLVRSANALACRMVASAAEFAALGPATASRGRPARRSPVAPTRVARDAAEPR